MLLSSLEAVFLNGQTTQFLQDKTFFKDLKVRQFIGILKFKCHKSSHQPAHVACWGVSAHGLKTTDLCVTQLQR